ncbi:hypothetical protein G7Y89_g1042 [Cudoniella acicularis]|uniref:Protein kinase domain-containing protein n=1 Tax=Cudoniella acicularis TaxID=354080 RepID=A0A8H4W7D0_9HELO|nr:hypothetical protein G7Y89_g1042 [Cudoniella acicularis]
MATEASYGIPLARKYKHTQTLRHTGTAKSNQYYTIVASHGISIVRQCKTTQPLRCIRTAKSSRYYSIIDSRGNIIARQYRPLKPYVVHELPSKSSRHHTIGRAECDIQPGLRHPNIVESHRAFIYEDKTHVVYELCASGSLRDLVQQGPVPEGVASRMFVQLMGAIKYMHSKGVTHRDLKLDNILLDAAENIKMADFSHAAYTQQSDFAQTRCGTLGYMAPEMFSSQPKGREVDIWSAGVVFFILLRTSMPFFASGCGASCCKVSGRCKSIPDKHNEEIREKICAYDYQWPESFPIAAKGLVGRLLVGPKSRPTPDDIVKDPFFTSQELRAQSLHRENCRLAGVGRTMPNGLHIAHPNLVMSLDSSGNAAAKTPTIDTFCARGDTYVPSIAGLSLALLTQTLC